MHKILMIGRLTKDAKLRFTAEGKQVADFGLAVNDGYGDNKKVIWFRCSMWGERAAKLADYLKKGTLVYVEGRLAHQDGNPRLWGDPVRASFELFVADLELLGGKKQESEDVPF